MWEDRFNRPLGEARSRSQEARISSETRGHQSARIPRGPNREDGAILRQLAAKLEHQGLSYDDRLRSLEGRWEETVASLRLRMDLLETHYGHGMEYQEVRGTQSLAESVHKRFLEIEGQLRKQQEGLFQLQSEVGISLKLVRVDAARVEGAQEAKLEELTERLMKKAEQVTSVAESLRLLPSPRHERDDRGRPLDAREIEVCVHEATRKAVNTLEGNLQAIREQQETLDLQVTKIMSSVKACGEEQERLSQKSADQDRWVRETVNSGINEFRNTEERVSRRAADDGGLLREALKSEVSQLRATEELLSRRISDRDTWLREALMSEISEFRCAEEDRYRDATFTAEHALAECSQHIRGIGAELEKELGAERGETLRSLAALEGRLDALAAERSQGISNIEARLNSLDTERALGRSEARAIAALETRLEVLAAERTSVQAEATSGVATLGVHIDGVASRIAGLEARLTRDVEGALCQADEAAVIARAAEETAQRGEANSRASATRLEAKLEAWLEARRDMTRDTREELGRVALEVAEAQARSFGARAEEEAEVAGRIARRAESAVRQLRENEHEAAGQWMRAEANLSERLMRFSNDEATSAGRMAQRTENALSQLQKQMQDLAVSTSQKCTAANSIEARCDAWFGDLSAAISNLREECSARIERTEVRGEFQCGELTTVIDKMREECLQRIRESQSTSERVVEDRLRQLQDDISITQNLRAGEVREHLASIAEQITLFESRLAPEALARLVRREVQVATREAVQEEVTGQMQSGWFQQADFKFDCTLQCLHVLYLNGGISPSGALSTLQRVVRGGGPSDSGGFASSSPSPGVPSTAAASGPIGSGGGAHLSASPARCLTARGPGINITGISTGPGVPGGPGGRDVRSTGSSQAWARSSSLASPRATAPLGLGSPRRPRRIVADFSMIE